MSKKKGVKVKGVKSGLKVGKPVPIELVSFSVYAIIPTQQYGNIQPRIEVKGCSIEEARAAVMPVIEDLYRTYAEVKPGFLGKITETVKHVSSSVVEKVNSEKSTIVPQSTDVAPVGTELQKSKSEPVMKAEKAIALAATYEAIITIQEQIEKSTKLKAEEKPALIELVLKRRNELKPGK